MTQPSLKIIAANSWEGQSEINLSDIAYFRLNADQDEIDLYNPADFTTYHIEGTDLDKTQKQTGFVELTDEIGGRIFVNPLKIAAVHNSRRYPGHASLLLKDDSLMLPYKVELREHPVDARAKLGLPPMPVVSPRPPQVG